MVMTMQQLLNISSPATCGIMEKELQVKPSQVEATKRILKSKGFIIVGTGPGTFGKRKIWFNPAGVNL